MWNFMRNWRSLLLALLLTVCPKSAPATTSCLLPTLAYTSGNGTVSIIDVVGQKIVGHVTDSRLQYANWLDVVGTTIYVADGLCSFAVNSWTCAPPDADAASLTVVDASIASNPQVL